VVSRMDSCAAVPPPVASSSKQASGSATKAIARTLL
jgi:hypothetical protein